MLPVIVTILPITLLALRLGLLVMLFCCMLVLRVSVSEFLSFLLLLSHTILLSSAMSVIFPSVSLLSNRFSHRQTLHITT